MNDHRPTLFARVIRVGVLSAIVGNSAALFATPVQAALMKGEIKGAWTMNNDSTSPKTTPFTATYFYDDLFSKAPTPSSEGAPTERYVPLSNFSLQSDDGSINRSFDLTKGIGTVRVTEGPSLPTPALLVFAQETQSDRQYEFLAQKSPDNTSTYYAAIDRATHDRYQVTGKVFSLDTPPIASDHPENPCEPVPEPMTMAGTGIAIVVGGVLKRRQRKGRSSV